MVMISVIGAGPCGLMAAHELAATGRKVIVHEEHSRIGRPVQCTGIVTGEIRKIVPLPKRLIINRIKKARIYASGKDYVELPIEDYVIDRAGFDNYLAERCEDKGVIIKRGSKIKSVHSSNIIIGADGPDSFVRKIINPGQGMQYYVAKQAIIRGSFDRDTFSVYLGSVAPGFFAWAVPENESTARVGLATTRSVDVHFRKMITRLGLKPGRKTVYQGGLIPIYNPHIRLQKGNLYIVGDAAAQVKATTGGGLVPGLLSARILARSIADNTGYEQEFKKTVGKELALHLRLRKMLDRFTDRDYRLLVSMLRPRRIKSAFYAHNRDNSARLCMSLLLKQPALIRFARFLF